MIETDRLLLRMPEALDFESWAAFWADPQETGDGDKPKPRHEAWSHLLSCRGSWSILGFGVFSVLERATNMWVGRVGCSQPLDWPGVELGWAIAPWARAKGYAAEAAAAARDWAFEDLKLDRLIHSIRPTNPASQAVARKLGSRRVGPSRLPPHADAALNDEWELTRAMWLSIRERT